MLRGLTDVNSNDSFLQYNINQSGLEQAEQNYFMKYASSGYSQVNNQRITKRVQTKVLSPDQNAFSKIKNTQNQVLRQLKQQYQILRNLPIQDKIDIKSKVKHRQQQSSISSSIDDRSQLTSSKQSRTKKHSRDAQILAIQKKQLQIVISNSLKKIQQLLQNQMELKKTIHQLKLQIQGKGGINSQYQMQIRNLKKNQKQLYQNIQQLKLEIQRKNLQLKQLGQKNAYLQGQKSRRDYQQKSHYDSLRQLQDQLRKQKDKSMNSQLQIKRVQMEFQIYQKDKTAEINRLIRQLDMKSQLPQKQSQTIRLLQQQIRIKDTRIQSFVQQIQSLKVQVTRPVSPPPQPVQNPDQSKKLFQQLIKQLKKNQSQSKDNTEVFMKAIVDKLGARKDDSLKNELTSLRAQIETIRRNSSVSEYQPFQPIIPQIIPNLPPPTINAKLSSQQQMQLRNRIKDLQRVIDEQRKQKRDLFDEISRLRNERDSIENDLKNHKQKIRQFEDTQQRLICEIQQLGHFKIQLQQSKMENDEIRQKLQHIIAGHQSNVIRIQSTVQSSTTQNIGNQKYQQEIRMLRRNIDELTFALNKAAQQRTMSQNMLKESQGKQIIRLNQDIVRYRQLLKNNQQQISRLTITMKKEIQTRDSIIQDLKLRFEELDKKNKQSIQYSRSNYESLLKAQVSKHHSELQSMNQKIIQLTQTNQVFLSKSQEFNLLQREVIELRRLTKNQKRSNQAIDHLWEIKQAQYNNIHQILQGCRQSY